jgi:hypothetical protein
VLLIVVGLLDFGYYRFEAWRNRPSEARRIAEAATITGFVRTAVVDVPDSNATYADAYFIGPAPKPDTMPVVSVPTIQLNAVPPPPASPEWVYRSIPVTKGERPDGCGATVAYTMHLNSDPRRSEFNLTAEQLDEVRNGTQVFIELSVGGCGW